jgi:hypothetical protein
MKGNLSDFVFNVQNQDLFTEATLKVFKLQSEKNPVYRDFILSLGRTPGDVKSIADIPFLPAEMFRSHEIVTENRPAAIVFESSRTEGAVPSRHFVSDLRIYERSFLESFSYFYGDPSEYLFAALLPSYTERNNSSLVYMVEGLIKKSRNPDSGFYGSNREELIRNIWKANSKGHRNILLGVSFALLDLAESWSPDLSGSIVMETGGMKGRRKEITREELHDILKLKLNVPAIHSEYGMTELLSQAYSSGNGIFQCPPWMKIVIRDPQDPMEVTDEPGKTGGINIIDLANINSCSFIATSDYGKLYEKGCFGISGRFDNSEIRGCNLMADL